MNRIHNNYSKISEKIKTKYYAITRLQEINPVYNILLHQYYKQFSESWNNLDLDLHMADNGKYRYRRYSVIHWSPNSELEFLPPEPHFQYKQYNYLNGDIDRYYSSIEDSILKSQFLESLILSCVTIFNALRTVQSDWRVECHQFRIVPSIAESGLPTPEGKHKDGVEYVFMMLVNRHNIKGGITNIYDDTDQLLTTHTLQNPCECIFVDDKKVMHEVSPVYRESMGKEAYRDLLVLTFQKKIEGM